MLFYKFSNFRQQKQETLAFTCCVTYAHGLDCSSWASESVLRLCTVYMNVHCIFCVATFYMHSSFEATKITHYLQLSMAHLFKPMSEADGINQRQLLKILAGVKWPSCEEVEKSQKEREEKMCVHSCKCLIMHVYLWEVKTQVKQAQCTTAAGYRLQQFNLTMQLLHSVHLLAKKTDCCEKLSQ